MRIMVVMSMCALLSFCTSVAQDTDLDSRKRELLEIDRTLARLSAERGLGEALATSLAADAALLPRDGHPIIGRESCRSLLAVLPSSDLEAHAEWEPLFADVSAAGDLGYTHGRYRLPADTGDGTESNAYGYYASVWKRAPAGPWQLAFSRGLLRPAARVGTPPDVSLAEELGSEAESLVATERAFSRHSVEHGMVKAFCSFMDEGGIAMTGAGPPLKRETFCKQAADTEDGTSGGTLAWYPIYTHVSRSGELGYNFSRTSTRSRPLKDTSRACMDTL